MEAKSAQPTPRVGPMGRILRLLGGVGLGGLAFGQRIGWEDVAIGLVAVPVGLLLVVGLRGRMPPTLRMTGPAGHGLVLALGAAFVGLAPTAALLFAGSSLILAATGGYAGCAVLALPNFLLRRNDEIGCPVFSPIDALEASRRREGVGLR